MQNRAAIYARVSTEEQAREGYSIDAQINTLKMYAKLYDYEVIKVYKDEGLSGKNTNRPALKNLLEDARTGQFDVLLVWKISRLSRNLKSLLNIVDTLDSHGVSFISQSETFNTSNPVGRMTLQILGSIAEFERNTIIENIKLGLREKAKRGEWLGGRVYGYKNVDKKLVVEENQAKVVKTIYRQFNEGISAYQIAKNLEEKDLKTVNNKRFTASSVYRILTNPVYMGYLRHKSIDKGEFLVKGVHELIIEYDIYNSVQQKINKHERKNILSNEFILSGLLRCPLCESTMLRYKTSKYRYYRCSSYHNYGVRKCKGFIINAEYIEDEIIKKIKEIICEPETFKKLYDNLGLNEIFEGNFFERFDRLELKKKSEIIRYFISKIIVDKNKKIIKIVMK